MKFVILFIFRQIIILDQIIIDAAWFDIFIRMFFFYLLYGRLHIGDELQLQAGIDILCLELLLPGFIINDLDKNIICIVNIDPVDLAAEARVFARILLEEEFKLFRFKQSGPDLLTQNIRCFQRYLTDPIRQKL